MDREVGTSRGRAGWGLIGGAGVAIVFVVLVTFAATALALDEDPTNNISNDVWSAVAFTGLIAAAVMLPCGITLLWSARRERKARTKMRP